LSTRRHRAEAPQAAGPQASASLDDPAASDPATDLDGAGDPLLALYRRPGFMLRRAHQIAVSVFLEEMQKAGAPGLTTTQYGVLTVLRHRRGERLDQISVARLLGLDRSTTALVVATLERNGFVARRTDPEDRRRKYLTLTGHGARTLDALAEPARLAKERLLGAFGSAADGALFLDLLERFTHAFDDAARVQIARPVFAAPRERNRTSRATGD
jgi:DNA-binding MarR family transcriptional regulator